jgi:hypothetical protein
VNFEDNSCDDITPPLKSVIAPRPLGKQVEHGPTVSHEYFTVFDRIFYCFLAKRIPFPWNGNLNVAFYMMGYQKKYNIS